MSSDAHVSGDEAENDVVDLLLPITYTKLTEVNGIYKMEEYGVTQDAVKLASNIKNSISPKTTWGIVNVAIDVRARFSNEKYASIPLSFGYSYSEAISALITNKVVEGKTSGWWFLGIENDTSLWARTRPDDLALDDSLTKVARKKGYIGKNELVRYFYHVPSEDIGPRLPGQLAILVNVTELKKFVTKYQQKNPGISSKAEFDLVMGIIRIEEGITIPIRKNTNQFELCSLLLGVTKNRNKVWEWEEILEEWGVKDLSKDSWTRVYTAARSVNKKVAEKYPNEPLFIYTTHTVSLNPYFV